MRLTIQTMNALACHTRNFNCNSRPTRAHMVNRSLRWMERENGVGLPMPAARSRAFLASLSRETLRMHALEPCLLDVRINLGRGDAGMTEHHLYRSKIRAVLQ